MLALGPLCRTLWDAFSARSPINVVAGEGEKGLWSGSRLHLVNNRSTALATCRGAPSTPTKRVSWQSWFIDGRRAPQSIVATVTVHRCALTRQRPYDAPQPSPFQPRVDKLGECMAMRSIAAARNSPTSHERPRHKAVGMHAEACEVSSASANWWPCVRSTPVPGGGTHPLRPFPRGRIAVGDPLDERSTDHPRRCGLAPPPPTQRTPARCRSMGGSASPRPR